MASTTPDATRVPDLLRREHSELKQLLGELDKLPQDQRAGAFTGIVHALVQHEVAEEVVVYPELRQLPGGAPICDLGLAEQSNAEEALAYLERLPMDDPNFLSSFAKLRTDVLRHADHEEEQALPLLEQNLSGEKLLELGARFTAAKAAAPTRPHPNAPDTPPGNIVAGSVAAVIDRMRDAMSKPPA